MCSTIVPHTVGSNLTKLDHKLTDLSDGLRCFDELGVVLVDQILHIAVQLLDL